MNLRAEYVSFAGIWLLLAVILAFNLDAASSLFLILRFVLSLIVVGYMPGYFLQTALFPREEHLTKLERFVVTIALSLGLIPLLALILEGLKLGFHTPALAAILGVTCVVFGIASWYRRTRLPRADRYVLFGDNPRISIRQLQFDVRSGLLVLVLLFLGVALTAGIADAVLPRPNGQLTEFYVIDAQGSTSDYPKQVKAGDDVEVHVGIVNHEGSDEKYHVEIQENDQLLVTSPEYDLQNAATTEQSVVFKLTEVGNGQQVLINLYRQNDTTPYRTLHLWIDVLTT